MDCRQDCYWNPAFLWVILDPESSGYDSGVVPGGVITEKVDATSSNAARVVFTSPEPVGGVEGIRQLLKARRGW